MKPGPLRVVKGCTMTWQKPPDTIYTGEQKRAKEDQERSNLLARTTGRTPESVQEAVELFKEMMASPLQTSLIVNLIWVVRGRDVGHAVRPGAMVEMVKEIGWAYPYWCRKDVLIWCQHGLYQSMNPEEKNTDVPDVLDLTSGMYVRRVRDDELAEIVRRFQLMPTQLRYLKEAISMPYRRRPSNN